MKKRFPVSFFVFLLLFIQWACSMGGDGSFQVVLLNIGENGVIGTGRENIVIDFSRPPDPGMDGGFVSIETDSSAQVGFSRSLLGKRMVLTPDEPWEPSRRYWLVLSGDMEDTEGRRLGKDFCVSFQSTCELIPVSACVLSPDIESGIVDEETNFFRIQFSDDVNAETVERAFVLSPSAEGSFEWESGRVFCYRCAEELMKNCLYTIRITDEARDASGRPVRPLSRDFDYCPNRPLPEVLSISIGLTEVFSSADDPLYLEDGSVAAWCENVEKDGSLRIDFSHPMDPVTLDGALTVAPGCEWNENWLDTKTVQILFQDPLSIDETYRIRLTDALKGEDGLCLRYNYTVDVHVNGETSVFLSFYAEELEDIILYEVGLYLDGSPIPDGVEGVRITEREDNSGEGVGVEIDYNEAAVSGEDLDEIEIRWNMISGFTSSYSPVIDRLSLQDSTSLEQVFGDEDHTGTLFDFIWEDPDACTVEMRELGTACIYRYTIQGGGEGVKDSLGNYLREDVSFCFKVRLVP